MDDGEEDEEDEDDEDELEDEVEFEDEAEDCGGALTIFAFLGPIAAP
jgi:hypothetical protein